ncbi:MAG: hypothetical protein JSV06_02685 [Myxococcales bacterium]|nr:MAG: hypothetical protein JSV06_02685 [Myxococcales bacterium]
MNDGPTVIRERGTAIQNATEGLRAESVEGRAAWLSAAADLLLSEVCEAKDALAETTGLSAPMVEWGARTTLETVSEKALRALADEAPKGEPISMLSLVLAGNLFTASVRAVVVPLLLGVPVLAKTSSRETLFPQMLRDALRRTDSELGKAIDLVAFPGGDIECERALIEAADAVAVYGGDETVDAIRARHPDTPLVAHGHGVSVVYCGRHALADDRIEQTISALALDTCAYDQRGCLSPQIVYVESSPDCSGERFAERLAAEGLDPLGTELPRGPLPLDVGAAQAQWRGLAEVEGSLIAGDSFGIAVRGRGPVRWSPGYRNVTVAPVEGLAGAMRAMTPLGHGLKCVGADAGSWIDVRAHLAQSQELTAYATPLGTMQTPALDAPADGEPIWRGLVRP